MMKKLLLFVSCLSLKCTLIAQVGNTTKLNTDYELTYKCIDSAGTKISYYEIFLYRPGFSEVFIKRFRANGSDFTTLPSGTITTGFCDLTSGGSFPDSLRQFQLVEMCDYNSGSDVSTPFLRLFQRATLQTTGAGTNRIITDLTYTGGTHTITGTVQDGPCYASQLIFPGHITSFTSGTLTGPFESWAISNFGNFTGTVTINGGATNLYPGQTLECFSSTDPLSKKYLVCPTFSWNTSSSSYSIITKTLP
jgi:hypothetical protein